MNLVNNLKKLVQEAHTSTQQLKGRKIRIIDKYYNDQPIGSSRKPLTGKIKTIETVWTDNGRICVIPNGCRCSMSIDGVEFIGVDL